MGTLAESVIVYAAGGSLCALSAVLLLAGCGELLGWWLLYGCCCSRTPLFHAALLVGWLPIIGLAADLTSRDPRTPAIALLAAGGVLAAAHGAFLLRHLARCCGAASSASALTDHPKSALLTPQGGRHRGGGNGGAAEAGGGPGALGDAAAPGDLETGRNPFRATYGLLPGSSSAYAYQIFLPGDDSPASVGAGAYTGLQSGPQRTARVAPARAAQPAAPGSAPEQQEQQQQQQQHKQQQAPAPRSKR